MKKKKLLTMLLAVVMVFSISAAFPQATHALSIVDDPLDFTTMSTKDELTTEGWSWNSVSKDLILKDFVFKKNIGADEPAIKLPSGSKVTLIGNNRITHNGEGWGIKSEGSMIIKGNGNISITVHYEGIGAYNEGSSKGDCTIDGAKIRIINSVSRSIDVENIFTMNSGKVFAFTTGDSGIAAHKTIINGGEIEIDSTSVGLSAENSVLINGGNIGITSENAAIDSNGVITVNGGKTTIKSKNDGMVAYNITIQKGILDIISDRVSLYSYENLSINGGYGTIKSLDTTGSCVATICDNSKHSLKNGMIVLGWDGKAYTKNTVPGLHSGSWSLSPLHTFADSTTKVAHTNLRFGQDISKAGITIASMTYTGNQIKPLKFISNGVSYGISANANDIKYGKNKEIGKGTVTLTGNGIFLGTKTISFNIMPKSNKVSKMTTGKKKMTVNWSTPDKKAQDIDKYQIKYRQKGQSKWITKSFKASVSSTTIKKLKTGKKYEVQVRSGKKVSGTWYYSPWSATKTTKKIK